MVLAILYRGVWQGRDLQLGGAGVARGYLKSRADLTSERFIESSVCCRRDRLYKTLLGDLGRYLADGNIEFLGRNDFQVKIRGFPDRARGDYRGQAYQLSRGLAEAAVLARRMNPETSCIVAYYTVRVS